MKFLKILGLSLLLCHVLLPEAQAQKLSITQTTIDCGRTGYMVPVTARFEIKNKGLRHLTIKDVKTDCGCTKAGLPGKSLGPGEKCTLTLTYDARMLGHFDKQAAIYSNGAKAPVYIRMKGVVLAELKDYSGTYPFDMGDQLLADRDQLEFDDVNKGDQPQLVINILNNSTHRMRPNLLHLPDYLTATSAPATLEPGRAGKITLTLHSDKLHDFGLTQTSVYLAGDLGDKVSPENEMPVSIVLLPDMKQFGGKGREFAPKLRLSADSVDMGIIDGKLKKTETITIANRGRTPLNISSMQMFTGGLSLTLGSRTLQPGEETRLKITADRERLRKARQKPRILMITNDPDHAKVIIKINIH
jgi:hypothetical protein